MFNVTITRLLGSYWTSPENLVFRSNRTEMGWLSTYGSKLETKKITDVHDGHPLIPSAIKAVFHSNYKLYLSPQLHHILGIREL